MNNMYKRPWRKRRIKFNNTIQPMQLKGNEKLLFFVDDNKWSIEDTIEWMNVFSDNFSGIKFCILPLSMFKSVQKITGKEYSMLNNILKRCVNKNKVNNNENS